MIAARVALLSALLVAACSHAPAPARQPPQQAQRGAEWRVAARGAVTTLAIADGKLSFCDEEGFHRLDAQTGRVLAAGSACPPTPVTTAPEITVRTPELGPDDIVEIEGEGLSFPIQGHARDWATDAGKVVIVGTASEVLEILPANDQRVRLSDHGATRVAVGGGWAAWWDGQAVVARRL